HDRVLRQAPTDRRSTVWKRAVFRNLAFVAVGRRPGKRTARQLSPIAVRRYPPVAHREPGSKGGGNANYPLERKKGGRAPGIEIARFIGSRVARVRSAVPKACAAWSLRQTDSGQARPTLIHSSKEVEMRKFSLALLLALAALGVSGSGADAALCLPAAGTPIITAGNDVSAAVTTPFPIMLFGSSRG